jgi:hypothetical protein
MMAFSVGDRVMYKDNGINGKCLRGEIVDIWENKRIRITNYFATLDSGIYVQFTSENPNWTQVKEPVLIPS